MCVFCLPPHPHGWPEFEACGSFAGARRGFVFKAGPRGVGYYADGAAPARAVAPPAPGGVDEPEEVASAPQVPASSNPVVSARQQRLLRLKMKMNKARKSNQRGAQRRPAADGSCEEEKRSGRQRGATSGKRAWWDWPLA